MGRLMVLLAAVLVACSGSPPPAAPPPARLAESAPEPPLETLRVERNNPRAPQPTVVTLHGYGATPEGIVGLLDGWAGPGRILAPRAPSPAGRGYSWFALSSEAGGFDALAPGVAAAADRVAAFIRDEVDGPAVLTGFSQGGMISWAVAVRHPEVVSLVVPLGGMLPQDLMPAGGPPPDAPRIIALHGASDSRVPVDLAKRTAEPLRAQGWDVTLRTWGGVDHTVTPTMRALLVREVEKDFATR